MIEHVKCGTQLQGRNFKYLKDTKMLCMQLPSTIPMGKLTEILITDPY